MAYPNTSDSVLRAIAEYYSGSNNPIWNKIQLGTATAQEVSYAYSQIPQMQFVSSPSGRVLGVEYADPIYMTLKDDVQIIVDGVDSNYTGAASGAYGFRGNIPVNTYGSSGSYTAGGGATTGGGNVLATVADRVSLAATGASLGCKLGAAIDGALYNLDPDWWDTNYPAINPDTWDSIATTKGGKYFINTLFGTNGSTMTSYMPSEALAYTYMMLRDLGAFSDGTPVYPEYQDTGEYVISYVGNPQTVLTDVISHITRGLNFSGTASLEQIVNFVNSAPPNAIFTITCATTTGAWGGYSPLSIFYSNNSYPPGSTINLSSPVEGMRLRTYGVGGAGQPINITEITTSRWNSRPFVGHTGGGGDDYHASNIGVTSQNPIPGIRTQPDATVPDSNIITGTTLADVLSQLKQYYPDLFTDSIHTSVLQEDGTLTEFEYVPVPWPDSQTQTSTQTTTGEATQTDTQIDDRIITDLFPPTDIPNPPDTGSGDGSVVVTPSGSASSLWAVYHPSQTQLNAFGAWLWSSDFVEQLKRLFNDPMQAIIGVHKVFAPIPTGGSRNIKCGYLDSGVSSLVVASQYTEVSCGTVNCREYFGNVFDYDPHTRVSIYLPFIGVVPLKVSEVMRASITVTYGVDVITGACLAKVKVDRDGGGAILYSFGGSCACHYPISAGSYAGIISGIVTSAVGVASGIMSGNPLAAVGGVVAGARQAHTEVQHSGGFTGCAGAMGPKIPYLIITRPQTRVANDVQLYEGKPSNATQFIGDCTGFVRAVEVHFSAPGAFDDEAKEIEALLKSGVLISD